jgi:hypothetical protein
LSKGSIIKVTNLENGQKHEFYLSRKKRKKGSTSKSTKNLISNTKTTNKENIEKNKINENEIRDLDIKLC